MASFRFLPLPATIVDSRAMIDAKIPVEITDGGGMINEPRDFLDLPRVLQRVLTSLFEQAR